MTIDLEIATAAAILVVAAGLFIRRFARELGEATSEAEQHACAGCDGCGERKTETNRVTFVEMGTPK
ncbi:MAG: hypothetical protein IT350_14235 [Deltaproteobacteria bacterium]|nr:hypothetical protein [Deltaproteobacteria bacterium]